jgi:hypothetical protein
MPYLGRQFKSKIESYAAIQTPNIMWAESYAHDFGQPIEKGATVHGGVYDTERAAKGEVTMISGFGFCENEMQTDDR